MTEQAKIGEFSEGHLLKRAAEVVEEKTKGSEVLDPAAENRIPKFDKSGMYPLFFILMLASVELRLDQFSGINQTDSRE